MSNLQLACIFSEILHSKLRIMSQHINQSPNCRPKTLTFHEQSKHLSFNITIRISPIFNISYSAMSFCWVIYTGTQLIYKLWGQHLLGIFENFCIKIILLTKIVVFEKKFKSYFSSCIWIIWFSLVKIFWNNSKCPF